MFLPMADATKRHIGKFFSIRDWPDDEDDSDVEVMEAFDALPISYAFLASANPAEQIHEDSPLPRVSRSQPCPRNGLPLPLLLMDLPNNQEAEEVR